jgi:pantothenate kinase
MTEPIHLHGVDAVVERVRMLLDAHDRVLLGICGAPGSGKSTLAELVVDAVDPARRKAVWVPMDGYHLADVELDRLGRRDRKGAIDTFDGAGYLALLHRLGRPPRPGDTDAPLVYAPTFERTIEQPIAGAIPVFPETRLVVTEGNYLLDDAPIWSEVPAALTEVWFCDEDDDLRRTRLVERHVRFGKSRDAAERWADEVDDPNARRVARRAGTAAVRVTLPTLALPATAAAPPGGARTHDRRIPLALLASAMTDS